MYCEGMNTHFRGGIMDWQAARCAQSLCHGLRLYPSLSSRLHSLGGDTSCSVAYRHHHNPQLSLFKLVLNKTFNTDVQSVMSLKQQ